MCPWQSRRRDISMSKDEATHQDGVARSYDIDDTESSHFATQCPGIVTPSPPLLKAVSRSRSRLTTPAVSFTTASARHTAASWIVCRVIAPSRARQMGGGSLGELTL